MEEKWDGKIGDRDPNTFEFILCVALLIVWNVLGLKGALILLLGCVVLTGFGVYWSFRWLVACRPWEHLPALSKWEMQALRGVFLIALWSFLIPIALTSSYALCRRILSRLDAQVRPSESDLYLEKHDREDDFGT